MILPAQVELLACEGFGTISSGASKTAASQRPSRNWTEASGASDPGSDPSRPVLSPCGGVRNVYRLTNRQPIGSVASSGNSAQVLSHHEGGLPALPFPSLPRRGSGLRNKG